MKILDDFTFGGAKFNYDIAGLATLRCRASSQKVNYIELRVFQVEFFSLSMYNF